MEPYEITLQKKQVGNYEVEIMHDLAWAVIFINGVSYECQGNNNGMWLDRYDARGTLARPLQWILEMLCFGGDPEKVAKQQGEFDEWLHGPGREVVAAWRKALARAKWYWEHPAELNEQAQKEVYRRYEGENSHSRRLVLETFMTPKQRAKLGVNDPTPLQKGGDLDVPF